MGVEIMTLIKIPKPLFSEITQELLRPGKVIAACNAWVKNGILGVSLVTMKREKEELMNHKMYAKDWGFNT